METLRATYTDDDVSLPPNTADDIQPETVSATAEKLEQLPSTDHSPLVIPQNTPEHSPKITTNKSEFQTNGAEKSGGGEQEDEYNYGIELPAKKKLKSAPIPDVQPLKPEVQSPSSVQDLSNQAEDLNLPEEIAISGPLSEVQSQQPEVQPQQREVHPQLDLSHQADDLNLPTPEEIAISGPVSEVQSQQPEVQPRQDLSHQGDDLNLPTPDEEVTPLTAKLGSKSKSKKSKKKNNNNVWTRPTSRKGKKKPKANQNNGNHTKTAAEDDKVLILPIPKFPDKNDDNPESSICLSKFYKAEKVEISEDRLSAGSTKGYRMVRATRGVVEGAWYFEIKVMHLGETGHCRLGWSTEKGDLQAPVGFDGNSFGYRDVDGSKVHKALREVYGEDGYGEGDVLGFYINLPDGSLFAPKPPRYVWFKGQRYIAPPDDEDGPKVIPGSEICFFKNGICQGTAFTDLFGGRYFPAASMYTLPNQSNCLVRFNFGPDFDSFPEDFGGRQLPRPMIEVPYHVCDNRAENGSASLWNATRTSTMLKVTKEQGTLFVEASELDID